jgi:hypothetical protein
MDYYRSPMNKSLLMCRPFDIYLYHPLFLQTNLTDNHRFRISRHVDGLLTRFIIPQCLFELFYYFTNT